MESSTPGIFHAAPSVLSRIDRVQARFVRETGMTETQAIEVFRLAPLCARRDMAMLGALHKINLGTAAKQLSELFPVIGASRDISHWPILRRFRPLHCRQLFTHCKHNSTDMMNDSLFGLAQCYDVLPQSAVDQSLGRAVPKKLAECTSAVFEIRR